MLNDQELEIMPRKSKGKKLNKLKEKAQLQVYIYEDENSISVLAEAWLELVLKADSTIYATPEWAECWWKNFGKNKHRSLYILTIWDRNTLVGLAPFYKGETTLFGKVIEQRLQLIGSGGSPSEQLGYKDDYGISDFLDFIVDPDYAKSVTEIFAKWLQNKLNVFASITLHQVRDDSYFISHLYPKLLSYSISVDMLQTDTCPYIDLDGIQSIQQFITTVKSNARRRLRQTMRAVHEDSLFRIEEINTPEELSNATDILIKMHQERWNEIGYPGLFYDKRYAKFFMELIEIANRNNWLWFKQTSDTSGVNSSRIILKFNGRFYDYVSGFDSNSPSAKHRPGYGLLLEVIDDAIQSGIKGVELLRGEETYKYDFTDKKFCNWTITLQSKDQKRISGKAFDMVAFVYKYWDKEQKLLEIHTLKHGILRGLISYLKFRSDRIRTKLKSEE